MLKENERIPPVCAICRNEKWSEMLLSGEKSINDAIITFHMSEPEVIAHMKGHPDMTYGEMYNSKDIDVLPETKTISRPKIDLDPVPKIGKNPTQDEITNHLYAYVNRIQDWLELIMRNDPYLEDRGNIDSLLKITDRIFKGLEQAAKLQGLTDNATTKITNNYVEVKGNLNMIQKILLENTCSHCRPDVVRALEGFYDTMDQD